jgi:hypothetical protein
VKAARHDFRETSVAAEGVVHGLKERLNKEGTGEDRRARVVSRKQALVVEGKPRLEGARDNRTCLPTGDERRWPHADTIMAL